MNILPEGLFDTVLLKVAPKYILRLLPHISYLRNNKSHTDLFLLQYIDKDQDRLHELFGEVAKSGWWELFRYLWYHRLGINDTSIRERRSLQLGWEQAFRSDHIDVAVQIFEIDKQFLYKYCSYKYTSIGSLPVVTDGVCSAPFMRLRLMMAVEGNDYEKFSSLYSEIQVMAPDQECTIQTVVLALARSPTLEFYEKASTLLHKTYDLGVYYTIHTRVMSQMLRDGRFEFIQEFDRSPSMRSDPIYWENILESTRSDSLDLYISTQPEGWNGTLNCFGIPNYCDLIFRASMIGNRELLKRFIDDCLANRFVIKLTGDYHFVGEIVMSSYKALSPERFIQVLTILMKRPNIQYNIDSLYMFGIDMQRCGYDYLVKYIESLMLLN